MVVKSIFFMQASVAWRLQTLKTFTLDKLQSFLASTRNHTELQDTVSDPQLQTYPAPNWTPG